MIVIERPSPLAVLAALANLTGHMPLPPRWSLGFQQCRYSYAPAAEVERIAREFRARALPCDVLWMDIDYMDRRKPFTFDPRGFPSPRELADTLHSRGFRSVWILDPGIKQESGDMVYEQGTHGRHWVMMPDSTPFVGRVWPGACVFPNFTRRATRPTPNWAGRAITRAITICTASRWRVRPLKDCGLLGRTNARSCCRAPMRSAASAGQPPGPVTIAPTTSICT